LALPLTLSGGFLGMMTAFNSGFAEVPFPLLGFLGIRDYLLLTETQAVWVGFVCGGLTGFVSSGALENG
jgi:hypothetical protein